MVLQQPSAVKMLVTNSLLRQLKLYVKAADIGQSDADDINDAIRHAVTATAINYAAVFDDMLREIGI
jgi:hypothetical protein